MKVTVSEYGGHFSIRLKPETIAEATLLIRLGMNATKEVRSVSASAGSEEISACVVIGKHKKPSAQVAKGKW